MPEESVIMVHVVTTEEELEESTTRSEYLLDKVDLRAAQTGQRMKHIMKDLKEMEKAAHIQYMHTIGMVTSSFALIRSILQATGLTMTSMQNALLTAIESVIRAMTTMNLALSQYYTGALGPIGLTIAATDVTLGIASTMMMVTAEATARQEFADIQRQIRGTETTLQLLTQTR